MNNIGLSNVANQIVRHALVRQGRENEALHLHFDLHTGYCTDSVSFSVRRGLHLLYHTNMTCISVFSTITDNPFTSAKAISNWKHECTHDSCWADIPVFSLLYFGMADIINEQMKEKGLKEIPPCEMVEYNSFGYFDKLYYWLPARVRTDPTCENNYRKVVELL